MFLIAHVPHGDAGLAIITMTLIMRAVLYPVFTSSIRTQMGMQAMQGELDVVSARYKDDKEALARERIALLKKYKVNPFAGVVALILQLVLIIALYYAMFREGFPVVDKALLYSFVHAPAFVSTNFFGILDLLTPHHVILALLVGASQYMAIRLTLMRTPAPQGATEDKLAAHKMQQQMLRYFMPAMITVVAYFFAGAVGLYFLTTNIVSLGQELLVRRQFKNL